MTDKEIMEALIAGKIFVHPSGAECWMAENGKLQFKGGEPRHHWSFPFAIHNWKLKKRTVYVNLRMRTSKYPAAQAYWYETKADAEAHVEENQDYLDTVVPVEIDG